MTLICGVAGPAALPCSAWAAFTSRFISTWTICVLLPSAAAPSTPGLSTGMSPSSWRRKPQRRGQRLVDG